jgi:hypothetical protein
MNQRLSPAADDTLHLAADPQPSRTGEPADVRHDSRQRPQPRANWAWMATKEHYDWMDTHAPFSSSVQSS